jgi:Bacterial antitoxin of type II TA system, VapB
MKTTVEIADSLFSEARRLAERERTTLRALVEEGLRKVVAERSRPGRFRLRRASFRGQGLQPPLTEASWDRIREMSYEGRGT